MLNWYRTFCNLVEIQSIGLEPHRESNTRGLPSARNFQVPVCRPAGSQTSRRRCTFADCSFWASASASPRSPCRDSPLHSPLAGGRGCCRSDSDHRLSFLDFRDPSYDTVHYFSLSISLSTEYIRMDILNTHADSCWHITLGHLSSSSFNTSNISNTSKTHSGLEYLKPIFHIFENNLLENWSYKLLKMN